MSTIEFNKQVVLFSNSLNSFAYTLTKNIEDSKDLIQETIYRALVNKDKFMDNTNLKAWMYTIMRNIFINNYRRASKRTIVNDESESQFVINMHAGTAYNSGESKLIFREMDDALHAINDELRIPFMMHHEGYKYHEIAEYLNIPLGTVKSRIFFARRELKQRVQKY
ncbi:MAG: RNA polymerase sigma factor [Chitinophagales bacterium]|nr:RNA polymerase sigma factor [Chitinophagales bacterium]